MPRYAYMNVALVGSDASYLTGALRRRVDLLRTGVLDVALFEADFFGVLEADLFGVLEADLFGVFDRERAFFFGVDFFFGVAFFFGAAFFFGVAFFAGDAAWASASRGAEFGPLLAVAAV